MNHLVHYALPEGSLVEIAPSRVEVGKLEDGGYIITATDDTLNVRIALSDDDFVNLVRSSAEKLDEEGAPSGKIATVSHLPAGLTARG